MIRKNWAFLFLFATLLNCSKQQKINLIFDSAQGLMVESPIAINGFVLGEIETIKLLPSSKILVTANINEDLDLPMDTKFILQKNSLFEKAQINLELGKSEELISAQDTVIGIITGEKGKLEELVEEFVEIGVNRLKGHFISKENIKIIKVQQHPSLPDHKRLIVVGKNGKRIDKMRAYSDPGQGCSSHLFEKSDVFILIDCNGSTFSISKNNGIIKKEPWTWMKDLPEKYLGAFVQQSGQDDYLLVQKPKPTLSEVYRFKDPMD